MRNPIESNESASLTQSIVHSSLIRHIMNLQLLKRAIYGCHVGYAQKNLKFVPELLALTVMSGFAKPPTRWLSALTVTVNDDLSKNRIIYLLISSYRAVSIKAWLPLLIVVKCTLAKYFRRVLQIKQKVFLQAAFLKCIVITFVTYLRVNVRVKLI